MKKNRKHIRLSDWDYSSSGIYFITICCQDKKPFFGKIDNNGIIYSQIGLIASQYWLEIPKHFPHVKIDEYIVMPNHIHGILILNDPYVVWSCHGMTIPSKQINNQKNRFAKPIKNSVSVIINQYKSSVKRWCIQNGFNNFQWQTRFYDHICNNENSINRIRKYIQNNPNNLNKNILNG
jgi:putative transposase